MPYKKISGIYKISCSVDNKIYIGSSINLMSRKRLHFKELRENKHRNDHMQKAYNKYGVDTFRFEIIEYVEPPQLIEREQYWIDTLRPQFNICSIAGSQLGCKRTDEAKEKMRNKKIGRKLTAEHKLKISQANKGKKLSSEQREKLSKSLTGRKFTAEHKKNLSESHKGIKQSEETIQKRVEKTRGQKRTLSFRRNQSERFKGRKCEWLIGRKHTEESKMKMRGKKPHNTIEKKINAHDKEGNLISNFNNTWEAGNTLNIKRPSRIHEACRGELKTYKGYIWEYV